MSSVPGSPADVTLTSSTAASVDGAPLSPEIAATRLVGVGAGAVSVEPAGGRCPAAERASGSGADAHLGDLAGASGG